MALALRHAHTAQSRHECTSAATVHGPRAKPACWALNLSSQRRGCTAAHCRTGRPTWHTCSATNPETTPPAALDALRRYSTALLGFATSLALVRSHLHAHRKRLNLRRAAFLPAARLFGLLTYKSAHRVTHASHNSNCQVLGPCDEAQAARTGGRVGGHLTASLARKR